MVRVSSRVANETAITPRPIGRGRTVHDDRVDGTECQLASRAFRGGRTQEVGMAEPTHEETPLVEETLVEEVSIDGMCGVY